MINKLSHRPAKFRHDESGQMAILVVLVLPVVFSFLALGIDAGLWYFDHRTAQNQADTAVLAAAQFLPDTDTSQATAAVDTWLTKNGSGPGDRSCLEYFDLHPAADPDGSFDAVRVCVARQSPAGFAGLLGIPFVRVSAAAMARVGPVSVSNVMPWGIVPTDPDCANPAELCQNDPDGDGIVADCGYYPPVPASERLCPWGLDSETLFTFKVSGSITPGNFGAIAACGQGVANYRDCVSGSASSGFFEAGETVNVETQTGSGGANTNTALNDRYAVEGADGIYECDIEATPEAISGLDPDGKAAARDAYVDNPIPGCEFRLVSVAILHHLPSGGSEDILVLGVATFAIAKWDRNPNYGNALGNDTEACGQASGGGDFECGMVWGYLMDGAQPPDSLLQRISDSDNPFAPTIIAMVE